MFLGFGVDLRILGSGSDLGPELGPQMGRISGLLGCGHKWPKKAMEATSCARGYNIRYRIQREGGDRHHHRI